MMELSSFLSGKESLTEEQLQQLILKVRSGARNREQFQEQLQAMVQQHGKQWEKDSLQAGKAGQGYFALGEYAEALKWLSKSGTSKQSCYLRACCLRSLQDYDGAIKEFEQAESKGCDSFETAMLIVDCCRRKGDLEGAQDRLKRISRVGELRAEYHYQMGKLKDANGKHEEAMEEYEQAIKLDSRHANAIFSLAFSYDLYGDETKAIEYYKRCIKLGPVHVSALLNLAVLYEEAGYYEQGLNCVRKVLAAYPNHRRAQMFWKDLDSSRTMYFDEDQEKKIDKRNQVLEIPISDFELSVRSRNCLKKMNIRTLGDLLRVSETELLAYKNFGETSLLEIKHILNQKNLRLGQLLEDRGNGASSDEDEAVSDDEEKLMETPVTELELSVRSRKCLQRLNIETVRDLIKCTEAELLGCKNFGMTSLYEIKQALKERNLSLRRLDD